MSFNKPLIRLRFREKMPKPVMPQRHGVEQLGCQRWDDSQRLDHGARVSKNAERNWPHGGSINLSRRGGMEPASALGLETLLSLAPERHGRLIDMDMKIGGAVIGFVLAGTWHAVDERRRRPGP